MLPRSWVNRTNKYTGERNVPFEHLLCFSCYVKFTTYIISVISVALIYPVFLMELLY